MLHKRWPYYHQLPLSLKALGIVVVVVPSFVISAERAGQRFERERWFVPSDDLMIISLNCICKCRTGVGKIELETLQAREQARWDKMTVGQKIRDVAVRHEYGMIGGAWAMSMVVAWGVIMRNPLVLRTHVYSANVRLINLLLVAIKAPPRRSEN